MVISPYIGGGCPDGAAGLRLDQQLLLPWCCRVRVRGVGFFLDFLYRPAFERCAPFPLYFRIDPWGQKPRFCFFSRKRPVMVVNAPERRLSSFFTGKIVAPRGAFTRITLVYYIYGSFVVRSKVKMNQPNLFNIYTYTLQKLHSQSVSLDVFIRTRFVSASLVVQGIFME